MQIKTGIDIIEIERIKDAIEKHENKFITTIFTNLEIEYCEKKGAQKYQEYAVRFAAKEAVFKALSFYYSECKWRDYEILNKEDGKPFINLKDTIPGLESIDISLSHCKQYAVANVTAILK